MAGKLPPEDYDSNTFKAMYMQVEALFKKIPNYSSEPEQGSSLDKPFLIHEGPANLRDQRMDGSGVCVDGWNRQRSSSKSANSYRDKHSDEGEAELIEQFEPGVYVTIIQVRKLRNGTKVFKRVRFSKRRFANQQAVEWWKANRERVFKKYSYRGEVAATGSTMGTAAAEEDNVAASSQN